MSDDERPHQDQIDLFEGRKERDKALDLVGSTAQRRAWIAEARSVARQLALRYGQVTSDDVRREFPEPEGVDPRIFGKVFYPVDDWVKTGKQRATKFKQAHARPQTIWRLR